MGMSKFPRGPAGRPARKALFEAFRNGGRSAWLPGLDWEALLSENLESLRRRLGVSAPQAYGRANRSPATPTAG
jgi:ubiquinone biosynthesis protein COQ4